METPGYYSYNINARFEVGDIVWVYYHHLQSPQNNDYYLIEDRDKDYYYYRVLGLNTTHRTSIVLFDSDRCIRKIA